MGFTKFAFLANDCGTGKTVTYGGSIHHFVARQEAQALATGTPAHYEPVLILSLSTVTPVTVDRLQDFFGETLAIYSVYGESKNEKDIQRKSRILSTEEFLRRYKGLDRTNPQVREHHPLPHLEREYLD